MCRLTLVTLLLATSAVHGATLHPQIISEQQLFVDAADGNLETPLFVAALAASPATGNSRELLQKYTELLDQARDRCSTAKGDLQAAEAIYRLMHERVLTGDYDAKCTSLVETMQTGNFNCVSATILYQALGVPCGLKLTPMATPSHVYCRLDRDAPVDIQTTCPDWFDYMDRPALQAAAMQRMPGWSDSVKPRELGDIQLVGKIYYNRGVFQLQDDQFGVAETNFLKSIRLDPDDAAAHENLMATWNNWALRHCSRGEFPAASALLLNGLEHDADYGPFRMNDVHIHQRWAQALCRAGRYEQAAKLLLDCSERRPDVELFRRSRIVVEQLWADSRPAGEARPVAGETTALSD